MGYIAKKFKVEKFNVELPEVYGSFKHVEMDIPAGVCRLDLHWFNDKESSLDKSIQSLDVWSFAFPPEFIDQLFKANSNKSAFSIAYEYIRAVDPRFENIADEI